MKKIESIEKIEKLRYVWNQLESASIRKKSFNEEVSFNHRWNCILDDSLSLSFRDYRIDFENRNIVNNLNFKINVIELLQIINAA